MISFSMFYLSISVCVLQEKLVQAIKRIKHEVDECREAERETYVEAVDAEVPLQLRLSLTLLFCTLLLNPVLKINKKYPYCSIQIT